MYRLTVEQLAHLGDNAPRVRELGTAPKRYLLMPKAYQEAQRRQLKRYEVGADDLIYVSADLLTALYIRPIPAAPRSPRPRRVQKRKPLDARTSAWLSRNKMTKETK